MDEDGWKCGVSESEYCETQSERTTPQNQGEKCRVIAEVLLGGEKEGVANDTLEGVVSRIRKAGSLWIMQANTR